MTEPLRMYRGDTVAFTTHVTRGDADAPVDVTGARLIFVAKRSLDDDDGRAVILLTSDPGGGVTVDAPETGVAVANVLPAHTEKLRDRVTRLEYAWRMVDTDGRVETLEVGELFVEATALRSTASRARP